MASAKKNREEWRGGGDESTKGGAKAKSRSTRPQERIRGFGRRKSDSPRGTPIGIRSSSPMAITAGGGDDGTSYAHNDLASWVRRNPNAHVSTKFIIRPSSLGGMGGFVADSPILEGELILRLPRHGCCISQDDALADPNCGGAFRRRIFDANLPSRGMMLIAGWIAMERATSILYARGDERERRRMSRRRRGRRRRVERHPGPSSSPSRAMMDEDEEEEEEEAKGGEDGEGCITVDDGAGGGNRMPYLRSLPWDRRGQDHVLYWSDEEVRELLGGSRAYDDAILIRRTVDDAVVLLRDILTPIIRNIDMAEVRSSLGDGSDRDDTDDDDAHDDSSPEAVLDGAIRGAFVVALTRSFAEEVEYENADGTTKVEVENVLLPLIDILQHSNNPNTILEPYDDCVLLRARRDVCVGEELFHRYQEENDDVIPPHKFFTRYGFVPGVRAPIEELLRSRSPFFFYS